MNLKLILGLILTTLVIIFIIQNVTVVEIKFFFWAFALSRALLIFLVLLAGFVLGWLTQGHLKRKREKSDII